jgi:hypothetical protein
MSNYLNCRNVLKFVFLLIFTSRILLGFFNIWFSWLPLTWFASPPAHMFTLPVGTTVATEYLIVNKNHKIPIINLLKRNSQSFLYENLACTQFIYVLLNFPKENELKLKAKIALERLLCRGLILNKNENFLMIKNLNTIIYNEEISCEKSI